MPYPNAQYIEETLKHVTSPKGRWETLRTNPKARNEFIGRIAGLALPAVVGAGAGAITDWTTPGDQSYMTTQGLLTGLTIGSVDEFIRGTPRNLNRVDVDEILDNQSGYPSNMYGMPGI